MIIIFPIFENMRIIYIIFFLSIYSLSCNGTSIVVYINSKLVVLGSDSRAEQIGPLGSRYFREEPKIYKSGNYFFSLAGFYNEILNSPKILSESLKDLPEINLAYLDSFSSLLSYRTKEYLTIVKQDNIDIFNKMTAAGGHVFDIVIAGKNKNIPFCAIIYIYHCQ